MLGEAEAGVVGLGCEEVKVLCGVSVVLANVSSRPVQFSAPATDSVLAIITNDIWQQGKA